MCFNTMTFLGFFVNVVYKMIYLYSCIEIYFENKYEEFEKSAFGKSLKRSTLYFYPETIRTKQYLFVENGNQTMVFETLQSETLVFDPENYDFILCNDFRKIKNKWINCKIIYNNFQEIIDYTLSSESILSFVVYYKDKIIDISLETKSYTYMIVGNRINKKFIFYLLKNMGFECSYEDLEYKVQLITSDVNILTMDSSQELIIREKTVAIV